MNIGWAIVQVTHMALPASLTCSRSRRDMLSNYRSMFIFIAFIIVFVLAFVFFKVFKGKGF